MKNYLFRSFKYLLSLVALYLAATSIFSALGLSMLTPQQSLTIMFSTSRGITMMIIVVILSLFYPKFGFITREVEGSIKLHRKEIIDAFGASSLVLTYEQDGEMIFEAKDIHRKVLMIFDDKTTVKQHGDKLSIEGTRRNVAYIAYRLIGKIESKK